jgi:hypothetical protein
LPRAPRGARIKRSHHFAMERSHSLRPAQAGLYGEGSVSPHSVDSMTRDFERSTALRSRSQPRNRRLLRRAATAEVPPPSIGSTTSSPRSEKSSMSCSLSERACCQRWWFFSRPPPTSKSGVGRRAEWGRLRKTSTILNLLTTQGPRMSGLKLSAKGMVIVQQYGRCFVTAESISGKKRIPVYATRYPPGARASAENLARASPFGQRRPIVGRVRQNQLRRTWFHVEFSQGRSA